MLWKFFNSFIYFDLVFFLIQLYFIITNEIRSICYRNHFIHRSIPSYVFCTRKI